MPRQHPDHRRVPPAPVQALHLVREDDAGDTEPIRDGYLEGISLGLTGDRAQQGKANLAVVRGRRQHNGGPTSRLLSAGLWVEFNPDRIPAIGNPPRRRHHASPAHRGARLDLAMEIVLGHTAEEVIQFRGGSVQNRDNELLTPQGQLYRCVQGDAHAGGDGLRNPERQTVAPFTDTCLHGGSHSHRTRNSDVDTMYIRLPGDGRQPYR